VEPSRVIVACVRTRSVELSYSYVQLLSRNAWHYNAMIREFGYHCELGSAFTVFDLMKKEGVSPDLHTYRALIDACGRSGEPSKAAVVFEGMIKDGIIPNVFVYNSLMNVNVGDMDEVQRLYDHMVVITCTSCSQTAFGSMCDNVPA
jgi:pentatricopeptide repeat protein